MHAGTQSEWVGIQHGLVLSQQMVRTPEVSGAFPTGRCIEPGQIMRARRYRLWSKSGNIWCIYRAILVLIDQVGLGIILLFCVG